MLIKFLIVVLFLAVLASLSSGLVFLFKDQTDNRKRVLYALGTRVCLAATLLLLIFYGLYSGALELGAPWHGH